MTLKHNMFFGIAVFMAAMGLYTLHHGDKTSALLFFLNAPVALELAGDNLGKK